MTHKPQSKSSLIKKLAVVALLLVIAGGSIVAATNESNRKKLPVHVNGKKVKTVVIDAGHGGKDPGCHGSFANEKDICLAISLKLGALIEEHFSDVKVVYTRKTDVFLELYNRAQIANQNDADLFICIHVNSAGSPEAYGAETYVMGLHKTEANLQVAKRENASILLEDNYQAQYEGFDPNSEEGAIIISMYQNVYLSQSISFATKVQKQFKDHAKRHDRGVRQAGFLVLVKTAMPAVLIETGFASNPAEERFLADPKGQLTMAESIFQAFTEYKKEVEGAGYEGMRKKYNPSGGELKENTTQQNTGKPSEHGEPKDEKNEKVTQSDAEEIWLKVQFLSSASKISLQDAQFKGINELSFYQAKGMYWYVAGKCKTMNDAAAIQKQLRERGYKDAFVVAFKGNERISVQDALQILNKNN